MIHAALLALVSGKGVAAAPFVPANDASILAQLPAGAHHSTAPMQALSAQRLDVALPLAKFDIERARATGDLRYLGYAEAALKPWLAKTPVSPQVLVLFATVLQSRHDFDASLAMLDRALRARPDDLQAWLTRATVLRVLGRYDEAVTACAHLASDRMVATLCDESVRGLSGHLADAYSGIRALAPQEMPPELKAWRYSELGEMAVRLGDDSAAEHWLRSGLEAAPADLYLRAAYADLLLRHGRAADALNLLRGYESMEPMLLRLAVAHRLLSDGASADAEASLANAFAVEQQRGEAVHRREQARFLLDVDHQPAAALRAAEENWRVQREPEDVLILLRAARAANRADAAQTARDFLKRTGMEDARLDPYRDAS